MDLLGVLVEDGKKIDWWVSAGDNDNGHHLRKELEPFVESGPKRAALGSVRVLHQLNVDVDLDHIEEDDCEPDRAQSPKESLL